MFLIGKPIFDESDEFIHYTDCTWIDEPSMKGYSTLLYIENEELLSYWKVILGENITQVEYNGILSDIKEKCGKYVYILGFILSSTGEYDLSKMVLERALAIYSDSDYNAIYATNSAYHVDGNPFRLICRLKSGLGNEDIVDVVNNIGQNCELFYEVPQILKADKRVDILYMNIFKNNL